MVKKWSKKSSKIIQCHLAGWWRRRRGLRGLPSGLRACLSLSWLHGLVVNLLMNMSNVTAIIFGNIRYICVLLFHLYLSYVYVPSGKLT